MTEPLPNPMPYPEQLTHIKRCMKTLNSKAHRTMDAFGRLHQAACENGALDGKTKELIALGIAVAARCDGCIAFHTHDVLEAGASREEIVETLSVAILMGGGPSVMYATHVIDAMDQFEQKQNG